MDEAPEHEQLVDLLEQAQHTLRMLAERAAAMGDLQAPELSHAVEIAGAVSRLSDVLMMRAVHAVQEQDRLADAGQSLAAQLGMRDSATVLTTLTGASRRTVQRWRQVDAATSPRVFGSTGALPPLYPHLARALHAGSVSIDQALVIRQHLHQAAARAHPEHLEAAERALVDAATGAPSCTHRCHEDDEHDGCEHAPQQPLTPELLAVQARVWRDAIDPDGPEPAYEQLRQQRSFKLGQRTDGMWVGRLLLPPDQGEALRIALDAHNAPRTTVRHDTTSGNAEQTGSVVDPESNRSGLNRRGAHDERSTAQRQADTLLALVTSAITEPGAPRIGGEPATLVVTITQDQLDEHARTGAGTAHLAQTGEPVPAHLAARIVCDGYLQACVLDDVGLPLKLGRARRSHTRHQRRAILTAYPGGCQNPGCHAPPAFTEIHHPIWWSDNGGTDTDNGIPLCQHCHTEVHAGRLRCTRDADGRWCVVPCVRLRHRRAA